MMRLELKLKSIDWILFILGISDFVGDFLERFEKSRVRIVFWVVFVWVLQIQRLIDCKHWMSRFRRWLGYEIVSPSLRLIEVNMMDVSFENRGKVFNGAFRG